MKTLVEQIEVSRKFYNDTGISGVLYKVYENNQLIYIGIGGKGNRKGFQRLQEHHKSQMYSSFRFKYIYTEGIMKEVHWKKREEDWVNLVWEIEMGDINDLKGKEKELIRKYKPYYNTEFKSIE
jgi:hypothetical protein